MFSYSIFSEEKKPSNSMVSFPYFPDHVSLGQSSGMVQLHFNKQSVADNCVKWIQLQLALKQYDIQKEKSCCEKCSCQAGNSHIVRLNKSQLDMLCKKGAYATLISIESLFKNDYEIMWDEIQKISDPLLWQFAAVLRRDDGMCTLKMVAISQSSDAFKTYVAKLDDAACRKAAVLQDIHGWCTLKTVASFHSSDAFKAYVAKLDDATCRAASVLRNTYGECTLMAVARYQSPDAFKEYVMKLDDVTCRTAAVLQDKYGLCTLMTVARFQSPDAFLAYVAKLADATCRTAALLQTNGGWCTLMLVAWFQLSESFIMCLNKLNTETATQALLLEANDGESTLQVAASRQSHKAFAVALSKMDKTALTSYLSKSPDKLVALTKQIVLYQSKENVSHYLSLFDSTVWNNLEKYMSNKMKSVSTRLLLRGLVLKSAKKIKINAPSLASMILRYDAQSPSFRQNQRYYGQIESLLKQRVLPDCSDLIFDYAFPAKRVIDLAHIGQLAVKVIRDDVEKNWPQFLHFLGDYRMREVLRVLSDKIGYKFKHISNSESKEEKHSHFLHYSSGKIVVCRTVEEQKKHKSTKKYEDGNKKNSLTYLSKYLHTGLFGYADVSREMVGVLVNMDMIKIKAMLSQDRGTYLREWVNKNLNEVINYANRIQAVSFEKLDEFKKHIDVQPYAVNEILAKVTRESIEAIFIGRDTPAARKIAETRQADFLAKFNRYLPIVFYDFERQCVYGYEQDESKLFKR